MILIHYKYYKSSKEYCYKLVFNLEVLIAPKVEILCYHLLLIVKNLEELFIQKIKRICRSNSCLIGSIKGLFNIKLLSYRVIYSDKTYTCLADIYYVGNS